MFDFFQRKNFLVDYLEGLLDIHNHILPGLDDGAKNVGESIALIKGFAEIGVTDFIATPHIMHNFYPNNPDTIKEALLLLKNELLIQKLKDVSLQAAAEHMIDDNFESIMEKGEVMSMGGNYVLVEMSYLQPSINFNEAIIKISSKNYFTILAHPERYIYLHNSYKTFREYKKQGILFQLNLLSLSEYYGKEVQKMAYKLLEDGFIDFVGSDVHNLRQLNSIKEIKLTSGVLKKIVPILENTNLSFQL